jgi:hypothetical protein
MDLHLFEGEAMRKMEDMAREAGWKDLRDYDSEMRNDFFMGNTDSLKAFEALVRADEREACAKIADEWGNKNLTAVTIAEEIRARGNT